MTLNNYQDKAMTTCLASCKNEVYAINGLQAEVGEIADKVAKWVRLWYQRMGFEVESSSLWFTKKI